MTPGEILAKMIKDRKAGKDTAELNEDLQKATCEKFNIPGTHVTCGDYEASNGGPITKRAQPAVANDAKHRRI